MFGLSGIQFSLCNNKQIYGYTAQLTPHCHKKSDISWISVSYSSGSLGRSESNCQMKSVSQNQIRQGEHDIQFSGLFSQTFVPVFSVPEQSFDYSKNVFNL